jgi:hypothetical protein
VEVPFKVSVNSSGFKHRTGINLKWRQFDTPITDLGSSELSVKGKKTLIQEALNGGSSISKKG